VPCFEEPFVSAVILEEVAIGWEVYTSKKMDENSEVQYTDGQITQKKTG